MGQWHQFQVSDAGNGVALLHIQVHACASHVLQHFDGIADLIDLVGHCLLFVFLFHESVHLDDLYTNPEVSMSMANHVAKVYGMHSVTNNVFNAQIMMSGPAMQIMMMHNANAAILRCMCMMLLQGHAAHAHDEGQAPHAQ